MNRIVLIEDDLILRENTLQFLKEEGFEAYAAEDGMIGLSIIKKVIPDLVLCDVGLPKMNGYETCVAIKKEEYSKDVPVIFLTAYSDNDHVVKGFEAGGQDYISKPFNYTELLARINAQLDLKYKKDEVDVQNKILEDKVKERTKDLEMAYNQLTQANVELLKLDETKTEFLQMISHELRTPLNSIMGPIQLLKQKVENKSLIELLELVDNSATRLEEFAFTALEITKIKSGKHKLNIITESLSNIVEFAILKSPKNISNKNISINYNINSFIDISCDRDMLVQSFVYILEMAGRFGKSDETLNITSNETTENIYLNFDIVALLSENKITTTENINFQLSKLIIEEHRGSLYITGVNTGRVMISLSLPFIRLAG